MVVPVKQCPVRLRASVKRRQPHRTQRALSVLAVIRDSKALVPVYKMAISYVTLR